MNSLLLFVIIGLLNCLNDDKSVDYIKYILENNNYNIYFTKVVLGSHMQLINMAIDTRRPNILVAEKTCPSNICEGQLYQETSSKNFKIVERVYTDNFHGFTYLGMLAQDSINYGDRSTDSAELVLVNNIKNDEKLSVDGLFGIGFSINKERNIIYKLYKELKINKPVFGLLLNNPQSDSALHVGGYDKNIYNETSAVTFPIKYDKDDTFSEWYLDADKVQFRDKEIKEKQKILINTVSNIIRIPRKFFFSNKDIFNKNSECQITKNNIFKCKCDKDYMGTFPNFTFYNNANQNITVYPSDYVYINSMEDVSDPRCLLFLTLNYKSDHWVLGTNFANNYYTVYDLENDKITFNDIRLNSYSDFSSTLLFCAIVFLCSIIFFVIIHFIYKRTISRREDYEIVSQ